MVYEGDVGLDGLLAKDGMEFVQACYRLILNREADEGDCCITLIFLLREGPSSLC